jgi:hypothetical protein
MRSAARRGTVAAIDRTAAVGRTAAVVIGDASEVTGAAGIAYLAEIATKKS